MENVLGELGEDFSPLRPPYTHMLISVALEHYGLKCASLIDWYGTEAKRRCLNLEYKSEFRNVCSK